MESFRSVKSVVVDRVLGAASWLPRASVEDRGRSEELDLHFGLAGSGPKKGRRAPKGPLLRLWWPWWAFFHPIKPQAGRAQAACPFGNR